MPSLSEVEGWHAPAGRRTWEPRPLAQARQIRPAAPVGARGWARPTDRSQDSPSGVGRFGGQAGPRPQTLRPYQAKTSEAGPEAQSTSSLPTMRRPQTAGLLRPGGAEQLVLSAAPPPH